MKTTALKIVKNKTTVSKQNVAYLRPACRQYSEEVLWDL